MIKKFQKKAWMMAMTVIGITMSFMACSNSDNEEDDPATPKENVKETLYAVGISQDKSRGISDIEDVVFTEDDILWFDVNTRELKFRDMEEPLYKRLEPFREIRIYLGQNALFTVSSFVALWDSRVFNNLVLCYGRLEDEIVDNGCYYLYDCYPLQLKDSEKVKANREKNKEQWNVFINYLESSGKLKK